MANTVLSMSMSVDGFISGPGDDMDDPFGAGGERLHDWLLDDGPDVAAHRPGDGPSRIVFDELMATGAVITGRRTGDFRRLLGRRPPRRCAHFRVDPPPAG
jgi:hypothetical protein